MGKQTFYLITALPPPRPPPHGPLPAQPLARQTQCAPLTLRERLARGAAPTRLPKGSGSFASLRIPLSDGTWLARGLTDTRRRGMRGRGILLLVENQPWHKLLWPQACRDGETLVQRCPCTTGCLLLILLAKVLEQADPAGLHPMPAFPTRWEVGTPFFSLLTGRRGLHSTKVHPNTAAGYLEPVAPIPGRGRAAASGGLDVFFLIAGQALSPAKQHVSHFL